MRRTDLAIEGACLIEPDVYGDDRGFFMEMWNARRYQELGIPSGFVQDNISYSRRGILRGLHFQHPHGQDKLVTVLEGEVLDVIVDVRRGSPTYGQWDGIVLSSANKRQLYIPEGCAHGFLVTSESALFYYKCSEFYRPESERTLRWDDPELGIRWSTDNPKLSPKDAAAPLLRELDLRMLPVYGKAGPAEGALSSATGGKPCCSGKQ